MRDEPFRLLLFHSRVPDYIVGLHSRDAGNAKERERTEQVTLMLIVFTRKALLSYIYIGEQDASLDSQPRASMMPNTEDDEHCREYIIGILRETARRLYKLSSFRH